MSQLPQSESLSNELLVTIERQRLIICNLLIKNQELRACLMHTNKLEADTSAGREIMRRRVEPGAHAAAFSEMRMGCANEQEVSHSAVLLRAVGQRRLESAGAVAREEHSI